MKKMNKGFFELIISGFHQNYLTYWDDNYDEHRFGSKAIGWRQRIKQFINRLIRSYFYRTGQFRKIDRNLNHLAPFLEGYYELYSLLNDHNSKNKLTSVLLFKMLGPEHYKLPLSTDSYFNGIRQIDISSNKRESINPGFLHFHLYLHDLSFLGKKIQLFHTPKGIYTDFVLEQYAYSSGQVNIKAAEGDVVIDAGACWGDTPIYFADLVGPKGKVYGFEFVESNLQILYENLKLNPELSKSIEIIKHPLHESSETELYFIENGPASRVCFEKPSDKIFTTIKTISIDDFVIQKQLEKVDMIKMDIEGAEPAALKGAINTLNKFKPKLAIAIYHSEHDFTGISRWIDELDLGYKFYLDHFTIYKGETILFCVADT